MGYALHIERDEPISIEEWELAVLSIEGIKLDSEPTQAINPSTGQCISISGNPGDIAVLFESGGFLDFGKNSSWEKCIYFSQGKGTFNATEDIENSNNPVHRAAASLAKKLSAKIVVDEGEIYSW
ncbi:hypothetical protein NBRC116583_06940 [Arenicella sp. 4NH20-0111]